MRGELLSADKKRSEAQNLPVPAEAFEKDFGVRTGRNYKVTIARLMQADIKDGQEHLEQIQDFIAKT